MVSQCLSYNYLDLACSPYGDYWREIRKICVLELFSMKQVLSFQRVRAEEVSLLIDSLTQSPSALSGACSVVNLSEKSYNMTANIICRVAFGKSFRGSGFDGDRFCEKVREAMVMLGYYGASDFFPSVGWIIDKFSGLQGRLEKIFLELDALYEQVIDNHLNPEQIIRDDQQQQDDDFVAVLLRIARNDNGTSRVQLTKDHIKGILMNIFLAGVDTSAISVVWAMTELVRNPRVMKKAQEEVRRIVGRKERNVDENHLDQLQFLKMVVKETLRLHPPIPLLLPRETMAHFKLNGYDIQPKTRVHVNSWAIARDPQIWKDPEEFFPERFLDSPIDSRGHDFKLLPFGSGRRVCPGIYMGTVTVELALANLLYSFDWKSPIGMKEQDVDVEEFAGLTVSKKSDLCLVPIIHQWKEEK